MEENQDYIDAVRFANQKPGMYNFGGVDTSRPVFLGKIPVHLTPVYRVEGLFSKQAILEGRPSQLHHLSECNAPERPGPCHPGCPYFLPSLDAAPMPKRSYFDRMLVKYRIKLLVKLFLEELRASLKPLKHQKLTEETAQAWVDSIQVRFTELCAAGITPSLHTVELKSFTDDEITYTITIPMYEVSFIIDKDGNIVPPTEESGDKNG